MAITETFQSPSLQDGSANTRLQIHDVYDLPGWKSRLLTQDWFAVCAHVSLHHAAPSVSGGENTKSFNSSSEAVFLSVQSCPKAADV